MVAKGPPWVLVAAGFHQAGGMDKANAALADYLLSEGIPVHLVAHKVDPKYLSNSLTTLTLVTRPMASDFIGERGLRRAGRNVARAVTARFTGARVLVNGGNCAWPDLNWVHFVHHAWNGVDNGAPVWFRAKTRIVEASARRNERRAISIAGIALANSERTRRDLVKLLGADPARVHTVYLGSDASWGIPSPSERRAARHWIGAPQERPLVAFVGAVSHDDRKGLGTLCRTWRALCGDVAWDVDLVVAGCGNGLASWKAWVTQTGLSGRIRFLGHTDRVATLLAAADLLVSPVRYEPYGLNVQEALCRGLPALVSNGAGVAERYPSDLRVMLLSDPTDIRELAQKLALWRQNLAAWRAVVQPLSEKLRAYTGTDMARRIVELAEAAP